MNKIMFIATAVAAAAAVPSLSQAQPVTAQSAVIGSLAGTTNSWPALWPNGAAGIWEEYLVTSGGGSTFLNAPSSSGYVIFRAHNTGNRPIPGGGYALGYFDPFGTFNTTAVSIVRDVAYGQVDGLWVYLSNTGTASGVRSTAPYIGVYGTANGTNSYAGVYGTCGRTGCGGVAGYGSSGSDGVRGISTQKAGLYGSSNGGSGAAGGLVAIFADGPISGNSSLTVSSFVSASNYVTTSDRRLKKDISDFDGGLADLEKIHVVKYKYNGLGETKNGEEHVGVIAQELEQIHPSLVSTVGRKMYPTDEVNTDVKVVNQTDFTYMLVSAVKELKGQVADLQKIVCQDHPERRACNKTGGGRGR